MLNNVIDCSGHQIGIAGACLTILVNVHYQNETVGIIILVNHR